MKKLLLFIVTATMLIGCSTKTETVEDIKSDKIVKIHQGSFAFCGASSAVPTGRKITVQGVEYNEGCAICPVLNGPSLSNLAMEGNSETYGKYNVNENFQSPDGTNKTVWSLFWYFDSTTTVPQFNPSTKEWENMTPINRSFTINMGSPSTSESNMFAMPGVIFDTTSTGIVFECWCLSLLHLIYLLVLRLALYLIRGWNSRCLSLTRFDRGRGMVLLICCNILRLSNHVLKARICFSRLRCGIAGLLLLCCLVLLKTGIARLS